MDAKFEALKALGAGEFEHLNGSLVKHLSSTKALLIDWGADTALSDAGLYHAAYGTAGFDEQVVSLDMRAHIAEIIGEQAEAIVYLYCACDRAATFSKLKSGEPIHFTNRFTGTSFDLLPAQARAFCELTVANELELVISSSAFKTEHGASLLQLFQKLDGYLSPSAIAAYQAELMALPA